MSRRREPSWMPALAVGVAWIALWSALSTHWSANPQYNYGWLVPFAQLFLAWRRSVTRPLPGSPTSWGKPVAVGAALALLPGWLILQPNPDWMLLHWLLAGAAVALTAGVTALLGGNVWARHFLFPSALVFAAVPWPAGLEGPLVQNLMQSVAAVTVEVLNLFGLPSLRHGNLIEIRSGLLGVDEACSGVRSLQATLMATLFLGEFYRFPLRVRLGLIGTGLVAAFLTNVVRTLFLAIAAARQGLDAVSRWHDPAGFTILTVCLVIVWVVALFFLRCHREPEGSAALPPPHPLPRWMGTVACAWLAVIGIGTELWYGSDRTPIRPSWGVAPPPESHAEPVNADTAELLRADHSLSSAWSEAGGAQWKLYFFEWQPGPTRSRILAQLHRPEVCLPAVGLRRMDEPRWLTVEAAGRTLPFEATRYRAGPGAPLYVYFCAWENRRDGRGQPAGFTSTLREASLRAVWRRERNLGQQVVEFIGTGYASAGEADEAFRRYAVSAIRALGSE